MNGTFDLLCAFGDSFSDNGFSDGHGFRRYSETFTWVEYLAQFLQMPLTDRAYSGATTGRGNYNHASGEDWSGLLWQVDEYLKEPPAAPSRTLFTVMCSLNDVLCEDISPETSSHNIETALSCLGAAGARLVVYREHSVTLEPPGFKLPDYVTACARTTGMLREINALTRKGLVENLKKTCPNMEVLYLISDSFFQKVKDGAPGFKFKNLNEPWLGTYSYPEPFAYAWYDAWHPGGTVHKLLAEDTLAALEGFRRIHQI